MFVNKIIKDIVENCSIDVNTTASNNHGKKCFSPAADDFFLKSRLRRYSNISDTCDRDDNNDDVLFFTLII